MEWLNYHHLHYFWTVFREGGLAPAAKRLRLSPQTVSGQIHALEESLGEPLFERRGRRLVLTDTGRLAHEYAEQIFALGGELVAAVKGRVTTRPPRLAIGVAEVVPKLVASTLIEPSLAVGGRPVRLVCREDTTERLMVELVAHRLDAVLVDVPHSARSHESPMRAYNHLLGECGVTFFARRQDIRKWKAEFPSVLGTCPMLLPSEESAVRRAIDHWLRGLDIVPNIVGEFDDSALMKVFGQRGLGVFPGPSVIADEIARQYDVVAIGEATDVRERFYVVTMQRKIEHPALKALTERARTGLFAAESVPHRG